MDDATPTDLAEIQRLLAVISPLPYWVEPQRDGGRLEDDAYIACGTRGDPSDTYDLIERYDVDTDYAYLVAAANAVPKLVHDLTTLRARVEAAEQERDELVSAEHASMLCAERDNYKAAFDAMRPFVAQIEQTIASAAEQIQQAEAVANEIAAERDRLASALAGVRDALAQIMYYATHQRWCQFNTSGDQQLCDCGFRTAYLAALPPGGGDTPND